MTPNSHILRWLHGRWLCPLCGAQYAADGRCILPGGPETRHKPGPRPPRRLEQAPPDTQAWAASRLARVRAAMRGEIAERVAQWIREEYG